MQELIIPENAHQLFVFKEVFSFTAAREQAEKKKLSAFGMLAKFNPLKRPTHENVVLQKEIHRYEPFWFVQTKRSIEYSCNVSYSIPVPNPYAQYIQISDQELPVARTKDRAKIDLTVTEKCHRIIDFKEYYDGLERDIKPAILQNYIQRYPTEQTSTNSLNNLIQPLLTQTTLYQKINAQMNSNVINASDVSLDRIEIENIFLYFRPVFAFEYHWANTDKVGVIEVDGLTGEVIENGNWFKDTIDHVITRETLIDISADLASTIIPGGGAIVKVANKVITK